AVEGRAHVVAHATVDADVGADGVVGHLDLLDGADRVEGQGARADDGAAGLDGDAGAVGVAGAAVQRLELPVAHRGHVRAKVSRGNRVVRGGVRDAVAATEVHLGHVHTVPLGDLDVQADEAA